ncbi:hypothetical protein GCM10027098_03770 [Bowmanella dokdonensis]
MDGGDQLQQAVMSGNQQDQVILTGPQPGPGNMKYHIHLPGCFLIGGKAWPAVFPEQGSIEVNPAGHFP